MRQDIEKFILDGARKVTPARLERLIRQLPDIRLVATQVTEFPKVPDQVEFLRQRPVLDAYIYLDGEVGFANLLTTVLAASKLPEARRSP